MRYTVISIDFTWQAPHWHKFNPSTKIPTYGAGRAGRHMRTLVK
jgi:hypothetical protein